MDVTNEIIRNFQHFDATLAANLKTYLAGYALNDPRLPIKYDTLLNAIKIVIYDLFIVLGAAILKIFRRDDFLLAFLLISSLIVLGGGAFLIFLGFFQILF